MIPYVRNGNSKYTIITYRLEYGILRTSSFRSYGLRSQYGYDTGIIFLTPTVDRTLYHASNRLANRLAQNEVYKSLILPPISMPRRVYLSPNKTLHDHIGNDKCVHNDTNRVQYSSEVR